MFSFSDAKLGKKSDKTGFYTQKTRFNG